MRLMHLNSEQKVRTRPDVCVLRGGTGNQLFQIAYASTQTIIYNRKVKFRWFDDNDVNRVFELLGSPLARTNHIEDFFDGEMRSTVPKIIRGISKLFSIFRFRSKTITDANSLTILKSQSRYIYSGFFQTLTLPDIGLLEVRNRVYNHLVSVHKLSPQLSGVLHVRKGDYGPIGWELDSSFYRACLKQLQSEARFLVIAETRHVAYELIKELRESISIPDEFDFHIESSLLDDFLNIVTAQTVVMSNSTFAWWATYVGDQFFEELGINRNVFAPSPWLPIENRDRMLCENWIPVKAEFKLALLD